MALRQQVRGWRIWFARPLASNKCKDLEANPQCALTFFDAAEGTTVSISGTGEVDKKLALGLWDPSWARWFPEGPEQRELALLRVIRACVERHDGRTGKLEVLFTAPRRRHER